ncbi:hypothetical protein WMY93_003303 [Mugilogobius chulae]|uniref:CSD domain-containing protein n=1 Tax=Mugilogobius chulae TaxID=88201 RepID=A0AAW0PZH3_9GOBI
MDTQRSITSQPPWTYLSSHRLSDNKPCRRCDPSSSFTCVCLHQKNVLPAFLLYQRRCLSQPLPPAEPSGIAPHSSASVLPLSERRQPCVGEGEETAPARRTAQPTAPPSAPRTYSATVRARSGPVYKGVCKNFSRSQGHGFIRPSHGGEDIFVHISDIDGEYVPMEGDEVTYKVCPIPPKNQKIQAVDVVITHLNPGTKHETWSGQIISS